STSIHNLASSDAIAVCNHFFSCFLKFCVRQGIVSGPSSCRIHLSRATLTKLFSTGSSQRCWKFCKCTIHETRRNYKLT
ncbi:unnamed protein product, partial [Tenebrio molitor]